MLFIVFVPTELAFTFVLTVLFCLATEQAIESKKNCCLDRRGLIRLSIIGAALICAVAVLELFIVVLIVRPLNFIL